MNASEQFKRFELTDEQVRSYNQNGFLGPVRMLDEPQVQALRDGLERMLQPDYPRADKLIGRPQLGGDQSKGVIHFQGAWLAEEVFGDLVFMPNLTVPLCQLLGVDVVRFFHDQIFYRAAATWGRGGVAPGLFVLDANHAAGAYHLLHCPG